MARKFSELVAKMSPESRARSESRAAQMLKEMPLDELRAARAITQENLAEVLGVTQATVSKIERRADMYVSTLGRFIQAMGGKLDIRAIFPEGEVKITRFGEGTEELDFGTDDRKPPAGTHVRIDQAGKSRRRGIRSGRRVVAKARR